MNSSNGVGCTDSIQGYLFKKGNSSLLSSSSTAWKKRWFSLENGSTTLKYFKNSSDESPKGTINIQLIESIDILSTTTITTTAFGAKENNNSKYYFDLKLKSRVYHLYSETERERDYWNVNLNLSILKSKELSQPQQVRPRSYTLPSPTPTIVLAEPPQQQSKPTPLPPLPITPTNNKTKPPLPPKPISQQSQQPVQQQQSQPVQQQQSSINNNNNNNNSNNNNVILNKKQQPVQQKEIENEQHFEYEDEDISLCGAKRKDFIKNHSNGYITSMVGVTRSKIWCGDSQGNICTFTLSRNGSGANGIADKVKKGSQWKEHTQMVTSLVYVPSQKLVYSSSLDGKICAWDRTDYSLVFSHSSKFPIYDMLFSKNDLLVYCGGISSSSPISNLSSQQQQQSQQNLSLFDTITKEETEIPFQSFLPNLYSSSNGKKRKFIKMIKFDEKIIICTDRCEIIVWSPWDNEICKYVIINNSYDITAMNVVGENLWICTTSDTNGNIFSTTNPCLVIVLSIKTLKRIKSFECRHPISQFALVNGYVWAITREYITVYEQNTAQLAYETIVLKEDMNFKLLYNFNTVWVGGTWLFRFQIFNNWIRDNLEYTTINNNGGGGGGFNSQSPDKAAISSMMINIQPISDYSDFDNVLNILELIKDRLQFEHCNQLYDILLGICESDQLNLSDFKILASKSFRWFGRNQCSSVMRESIISDNNRVYRISRVLSNYLQQSNIKDYSINIRESSNNITINGGSMNSSNGSINNSGGGSSGNGYNSNVIFIYETLKTVEYLVSNFDKFSKQFQIQQQFVETIIKFTTLSLPSNRLIVSISLIILYHLLNSNGNNLLNISSSSSSSSPNLTINDVLIATTPTTPTTTTTNNNNHNNNNTTTNNSSSNSSMAKKIKENLKGNKNKDKESKGNKEKEKEINNSKENIKENTIKDIGGNSLYNSLKDKVKLYLSIFFDQSIEDKTKISIINILSRFPNELKEQFKKEVYLNSTSQLLNQGTSLVCNDLIIIMNQVLSDSPKIKDQILKYVPNLLNLLDQQKQQQQQQSPINDRIRFFQIMSNPTFIQRSYNNNDSNNNSSNKKSKNRKVIISSNFKSPIESILFTINSILHSLKGTSFKGLKITILDVIVPKEFDQDFLSSINGSIINLNFILPSQSFVSTIKFKFNPKDLAIKVAFQLGVSVGETTISNFSITGDLQLGFTVGTAKPEYISFLEDPIINFDFDSTGVINLIDKFVKPILKISIRKRFVHPNRFYLPNS
ncbi:hypothetical protein ACTFIU_001225 [Dictyostelium citrinum]